MADLNIGIAREIFFIEGQNLFDTVYVHRRRQPSVMNFRSNDFVSNDQLPPFSMHSYAVWQQFQRALNRSCPEISFLDA